ncbi:MAG: hypothetical protein R3C99_08450 [Pirellulaceae bacterium]
MPFRRLPNSDSTRLQALESASKKAAATDPADLAFSSETKTTLDATLPLWKQELRERGQALSAQSEATEALSVRRGRLRMWVSHFFQAFNMAVARGVCQASERGFFQLDISAESLPALDGEADLLTWAERIVAGEADRTAAGGVAILQPTAAEIATELTEYETFRASQAAAAGVYDREQEDVERMREQVDRLIRDLWDEIEFRFRREQPSSMRRKAREYGVVYASRPGEPPDPEAPAPETPELDAPTDAPAG